MDSHKQKPGRALEKVVASLERALGGTSGIKVESPKHLPDRVTGEMREHDVVITYPSTHHEMMLAIECRDRSRKVTVNDVEGFASKCQDTRIQKGMMVSPMGFSKTSLTKAQHCGIACLTLGQAASFDWLLAPGVRSQNRQILHIDWTLQPEKGLLPNPTSFSIVDPDGQIIALEAMREGAAHEFQQLSGDQLTVGKAHCKIVFETPGIFVRDRASGAVQRVVQAVADIEYEIVEDLIPFNLVKYSKSDTGALVTDAAMADIDVGTHGGKVVIDEKVVARHFSKPNIRYLGAHTGCSCGFKYGCVPPRDEKDHLEEERGQASVRSLQAYLDDMLRSTEAVELYACWKGEWGEPQESHREVTTDFFGGDSFYLQQRELLVVTIRP
jgi:Restriction endonuclease